MARKQRGKKKSDSMVFTLRERDILGLLREHGDQLREVKDEVKAARQDIRNLREDFSKHSPSAETHEPSVAGDKQQPRVIPGKPSP
jgi:hypothetical protein